MIVTTDSEAKAKAEEFRNPPVVDVPEVLGRGKGVASIFREKVYTIPLWDAQELEDMKDEPNFNIPWAEWDKIHGVVREAKPAPKGYWND